MGTRLRMRMYIIYGRQCVCSACRLVLENEQISYYNNTNRIHTRHLRLKR